MPQHVLQLAVLLLGLLLTCARAEVLVDGKKVKDGVVAHGALPHCATLLPLGALVC